MLFNYGHSPSFGYEKECAWRMDEGWERREDEGRRFLNCRFFVEENFTTTPGVFKHLGLIFKSTHRSI